MNKKQFIERLLEKLTLDNNYNLITQDRYLGTSFGSVLSNLYCKLYKERTGKEIKYINFCDESLTEANITEKDREEIESDALYIFNKELTKKVAEDVSNCFFALHFCDIKKEDFDGSDSDEFVAIVIAELKKNTKTLAESDYL